MNGRIRFEWVLMAVAALWATSHAVSRNEVQAGSAESSYRALERQAANYIRNTYRLSIRGTSSNSSAVYVTAYRPKVGGDRTFRFDLRVRGRRIELVTPPTPLN